MNFVRALSKENKKMACTSKNLSGDKNILVYAILPAESHKPTEKFNPCVSRVRCYRKWKGVFAKSHFLGYGNDVPQWLKFLILTKWFYSNAWSRHWGSEYAPCQAPLQRQKHIAGHRYHLQPSVDYDSNWFCFVGFISSWRNPPNEDFVLVTNLCSDPIPTSAENLNAWLVPLFLYQLKVAVKHWN